MHPLVGLQEVAKEPVDGSTFPFMPPSCPCPFPLICFCFLPVVSCPYPYLSLSLPLPFAFSFLFFPFHSFTSSFPSPLLSSPLLSFIDGFFHGIALKVNFGKPHQLLQESVIFHVGNPTWMAQPPLVEPTTMQNRPVLHKGRWCNPIFDNHLFPPPRVIQRGYTIKVSAK